MRGKRRPCAGSHNLLAPLGIDPTRASGNSRYIHSNRERRSPYRMKRLYLVSCLSLSTICVSSAQQAAPAPNAGHSGKVVNADNTAHNAGGQGDNAATADKQSNDPNDIGIVQKIRASVVQDKALSFDAKNSKIIVNGGMVTLRGPVESEQEKNAVAEKAIQVVGKAKVKNELEVKARH
jgi:hyperosmotically inducible periplasmic protein